MTHRVLTVELVSGSPPSWNQMPSLDDLKQQIAAAVLADSEIASKTLGFYSPPQRIRNVEISKAAWDQITCMWHGHRARGAISPPFIPLKYFVWGFGQMPPDTWADIEILPGVDNWDVPVG